MLACKTLILEESRIMFCIFWSFYKGGSLCGAPPCLLQEIMKQTLGGTLPQGVSPNVCAIIWSQPKGVPRPRCSPLHFGANIAWGTSPRMYLFFLQQTKGGVPLPRKSVKEQG